MNNATETINNRYRIGAVARLTGISPDTLRIWERRYELVNPYRTDKGGRLYSQADVTRLTLIKSLVDQGHAISTVAPLSNQELSQRLEQRTQPQLNALPSQQHLCVVGQVLPVQLRLQTELPESLHLSGLYGSLDEFLQQRSECDTLVIELPFLDRDIVRELVNHNLHQHCQRLIVVYAFSPSPLIKRLKRMQVELHRAPLGVEQLLRICEDPIHRQQSWQAAEFNPNVISEEPIPQRLFSPEQLAELSQISTSLHCECPHHMSSIIETLLAFEQYSAQCEINTRQDAALHSYLHGMTARARWIMEVALIKLTEVENIQLESQSAKLTVS